MTRSSLASLWLILCLSISNGAQAGGTYLTGSQLKSVIKGQVIHLSTGLGTMPIHYRSNGTMAGSSPKLAKFVGHSSDNGRWWVRGRQLCQKWKRLFEGRSICYRVRKSGRTIYWNGGGHSGSAFLSR